MTYEDERPLNLNSNYGFVVGTNATNHAIPRISLCKVH